MKQVSLGRAAVALSIMCVLALAATIAVIVTPSLRLAIGLVPSVRSSYVLGERIDVPSTLYESSASTLILFARSDCGVCQRIKPWLADLVSTVRRDTSAAIVMVATNGGTESEAEFAKEIGLSRERVTPLPARTLKLRQVPALVLVDHSGRVLYSMDGAQPAEQAKALPRIVTLAQSR